jgi:NAD(P)H-flavin reductase
MKHSEYTPHLAIIREIIDEVAGLRPIKTFRVQMLNGDPFSFQSGQCAMLSVFGTGEAMISISSSPLEFNYLQFSILKSGRVTSALHELEVGNTIGIRGPYGNHFPLEHWKAKNLLFIGGGIGLAPIWSVLQTALRQKELFADLTLIYGARSSADLVYKTALNELSGQIKIHLSIDTAEPNWPHFVGFVPQNLLDKKPSSFNTIAVVCGPPIMIKFVIRTLQDLGFTDRQIYTTVENKMKCGIGQCGRCNIGPHYVCQDGPVYCWETLKSLPLDY